MHIPDGFLNFEISLLFWVISIILLGIAIKRTREQLGERQIPLMGVMAAFIFAAQMINFPIAGGTSGHLLGGALAAIVLGPWAGILVMTTVIAVQGLIFQDGGLLVMGANIFNMGLLTALIGYGLYRSSLGKKQSTKLVFAGIGAWVSVLAGALSTSLQLWLSGTSALNIVLPAMLGIHTLIGLGEALITVAALAFILRTRPDIIESGSAEGGGHGWIIGGIIASLVVLLISPLASAFPDGLERVAGNLGFIGYAVESSYRFLPDYTIPFFGDSALSTILAGAIGMIVVVLLTTIVVRLIKTTKHT